MRTTTTVIDGARKTSRSETLDNRDSQVARTAGIDLCNVVVAQSLFAVEYRPPYVRRFVIAERHDDAHGLE